MKKYRIFIFPFAAVLCFSLPLIWQSGYFFFWVILLFILSGFISGIYSFRKGGWITVISLILQIIPQLLVAATADAAPLLLLGIIVLTLPGGILCRKNYLDMSKLARISLFLFWLGILSFSGVLCSDIFIH